MQAWIISIMSKYGYIGVFLLILIENIFPPIPSEVILPFSGFMTTVTTMNIFGVVTSATFGSVMGAVILYELGRVLNVDRIKKIVARWGYILRLTEEDIDKTNNWFQKHGYGAVFFGRMVPIIRSLISIPAGMAKMNMPKFILYTTLGTVIWNFALVFAGTLLGESWEKILDFMNVYSEFTYFVLAFLVIIFIVVYIIKRRKK